MNLGDFARRLNFASETQTFAHLEPVPHPEATVAIFDES
jgi:hypothetical protein